MPHLRFAAVCAGLAAVTAFAGGRPQPLGTSTTTISYQTTAGPVSFSGNRDYSGVGPTDATVLGAAPNIKTFNSVNSFGRRPLVTGGLGADESVLAHAFFKIDVGGDYFPDLVEDGHLTITVTGIQFDQPVVVDESTFLFHVLWNGDQVDQLEHIYHHLHNQHTASDPFRDYEAFLNQGVFSTFPHPDHVLADVTPVFDCSAGTTLQFTLTVPYHLLQNLEEEGHHPPPGLPAPHGFLEPFHFHCEYVVRSACPGDSQPPQIDHARMCAEGEAFSGYIDPRVESSNGVDLDRGIHQFTIPFTKPVFDAGSTAGGTQPGILSPAAFQVVHTGPGDPPGILSVSADPADCNLVHVTLDRIVDVQAWTTIRAAVEDACGNAISDLGNLGPGTLEPDRIDFGFLPGDVTQDGAVEPLDLLRLRQIAQSGRTDHPCLGPAAYADIDRDGRVEPLDVLRFRQLLFHTGPATQPWAFETLAQQP